MRRNLNSHFHRISRKDRSKNTNLNTNTNHHWNLSIEILKWSLALGCWSQPGIMTHNLWVTVLLINVILRPWNLRNSNTNTLRTNHKHCCTIDYSSRLTNSYTNRYNRTMSSFQSYALQTRVQQEHLKSASF